MRDIGQRWIPRLLSSRVVRRAPDAVGSCSHCGVAFAGLTERWSQVEQVLQAHESVCPGGDRAGEIVRPFGEADSAPEPWLAAATLPVPT